MPTDVTKIADLINPEVMADMISAKLPDKIVVAPFAKIDTTLQGVPGDTITVPSYGYIGDAADVAEGAEVDIEKMATSTKQSTVKKAMKGVSLTDEAVLSGYGNPVGEANNQLALSIAAKLDKDALDALLTATLSYDGSAAIISYNAVVSAIDLFEEEVNTAKVMFINPKQVTQLRKDPDFLSADKYGGQSVIMSGEIGMIANTRVVPSRKVVLDGTNTFYTCPIVKLTEDAETEDELPAMIIYLKRDTNVETERKPRNRTTEVTADKMYTVALTNEAKVVLARFKK
ncbi:MAG: N4-gp56 family major capsid protein [Oscillospiraceae bacterium]